GAPSADRRVRAPTCPRCGRAFRQIGPKAAACDCGHIEPRDAHGRLPSANGSMVDAMETTAVAQAPRASNGTVARGASRNSTGHPQSPNLSSSLSLIPSLSDDDDNRPWGLPVLTLAALRERF